ncbi:peptidase M14 [Halomonas sp. BC04]|uniref:peptidase M14 n=1 Tax=Halomonas sp. BC04 TaxID=1403540 RepID=UPI0003ED64AF|nr:peptidase M14 [Halomonas sp. BC04]EWG97832.1 hypothetical protein Q427_33835 [Halomonas sp. BC04]
MTQILLEHSVRRSLDALVADYRDTRHQGGTLDAWVFDDPASRRAAEVELARFGIRARIHSAYKPLVHFFLEAVTGKSLTAVTIRYPAPTVAPQRFLLEAYPLAGMLGDGVSLSWEPMATDAVTGRYVYEVHLRGVDGKVEKHDVAAPNRLHRDHVNCLQLSPCGWVKWQPADGQYRDELLKTDYEQLFEAAMEAIMGRAWQDEQPLFEELNLRVTLPAEDTPLPFGEEHISLAEGLHEELYFSLLEYFQHRAGLPLGDRSIQPGQIVPEVLTRPGVAPGITVRLQALCTTAMAVSSDVALNTADRALSEHQVIAQLKGLGARSLLAHSRSGRPVMARYRPGDDRAVIISAAQHANETSGIVGALRAAVALDALPRSHFVISPLENPDGYNLRQRLATEQPVHMHHAARYTAFGNDLQAQPTGGHFEHAIREQAIACSGAQLHVNLHGYPAHEWTRPLTGYVPRGFELWTIPKGFFLIVRHHPGWQQQARHLLEGVTQDLSRLTPLMALNRRQIALYEAHAGTLEFPIMHDIPYLLMEDEAQLAPLMLITEYPDETLYGDAFVLAHETQRLPY